MPNLMPNKLPSLKPQALWQGAGLGLHARHLPELLATPPAAVEFMEIAPENWLTKGGQSARQLQALAERMPLVAHGLNLNLGGRRPLDKELILAIKGLHHSLNLRFYSEHLSWCADEGNFYDLLPLPFTAEAVLHVAARIRQVQDMLECFIGVENISYYLPQNPGDLSEPEFITAVLQEANCLLHLDVNNVYVNSINQGMDARAFIDAMPSEKIAYMHIAGHSQEAADLIIDTHAAPVADPVWDLLAYTYATKGVVPTLLERDFNLPPLAELNQEVARISCVQHQYA
ncbi:MAG TPA: DUF692 domain-containing protein [Cellvibrionaceae bacterium]|nr:DUF692 domain-containing protein [Cellvibrionaceae bacterium]HMW49722.1 DUF692 domain-containing protein [Cellvibrionaceae bacterium]HMW72824.1 DUF692 domain-containing protein [Cellvibrionaceae bacterium]HMY39100.1 DUF692 domain-containing protein [Marinagarivorans sp.]HNG58517.1 DUF692 domain-containing protein [Cellvibrionaceae bacterium]